MGELHEAKRVVDLMIVVGVETDLIYVKGFAAVDVGSPEQGPARASNP